ncbi:glycosyltransferase family A protein [Hymenobacter cheonanensis]|uniref:glycosyltransferase family A protein n=1 Tax=Hymenobacter sp. CA2-7 TaxID=3063993 RepID=UPI0027128A6D|nr:glycosyltransferase family A protein [Hymenobacter sp. CA2-7]MDO7885568.1 glycosyltransferase family A protein [Hymenobacter sp. CA2-7]
MNPPALPLVSVVVSFLNTEQFLVETIESVLQQEYPAWELVLIDDGSTDGSTAISKRYAAQHPGRIRYYEHAGHQNLGSSASRNVGVHHSAGELIALLDADDVWLPTYLAAQVALLQENKPAAMVLEATLYWYSWASPARPDEIIAVGAPAGQLYQPPALSALLYPLGPGAAPCTCGLVVTRQAYLAVGGFEASFRALYEDQAFLAKMYLHHAVYVSAACHNKYRQRAGSIMHTIQGEAHYHQVRRQFLEWLKSYLRATGYVQVGAGQLVSRALRPYQYPRLWRLAAKARALPGRLRRLPGRLWQRLAAR